MSHEGNTGGAPVSSRTTPPDPPAYSTLSSAPINQFANQIPSQAGSNPPPANHPPSPSTIVNTNSSSISQSEHHAHHHNRHHNQEEHPGPSSSQPKTRAPASTSTNPAPPKPKRKSSRKHSSTPRRPSHKCPLLDLNDPSLTAPGSAGRPFAAGGETRALTNGAERPGMIQYGSVYYYPLERQASVVDQEYETQGRRMFLLAVVAVVVVMGVLALSKADDHHNHHHHHHHPHHDGVWW